MHNQEKPAAPLDPGVLPSTTPWADFAGGASLGLLLGMLLGLSSTPIVSIVMTALVALLAGLFGLSDKIPSVMPAGAARRLAAFGLAATFITPAAIWIRTHEVLMPSIDEQKDRLRAMGMADGSKDQADMLRFVRFGLLPTGVSIASKDAPQSWQSRQGVLYSVPSGFCDSLARVKDGPIADFLTLFAGGPADLQAIGTRIRSMPLEKQKAVLEAAPIYLCTEL